MKKAFTLIELLVVIAIIAILAAILFPVFAQAKVAAKKTVAISNVKQIGTSIMLYMADYDDIMPRNDDCAAQSSLNPALSSLPYNPTGVGCTAPPFYNRVNHYSWQKWILPYMKNVEIFVHPGRQRDQTQWSTNGQIVSGFTINIALTGQLNTYPGPSASRAFRNSWLGGSQTAIPNVSSAMLVMEFPQSTATAASPLSFVPGITRSSDASPQTVTVYPMAMREVWANMLMEPNTAVACGTMNSVTTKPRGTVFGGGIAMAMADSSSKFMPISRFLAQTPTAAEYGLIGNTATMCGNPAGSSLQTATTDVVNLNINYPLWALGQ